MISVKAQTKNVLGGLDDMKRYVPRLVPLALNVAGRKARTRTRRELAELIQPRRKRAVNSAVAMDRANKINRTATIRVSAKEIGVEELKGTRTTKRKKGKRVVTRTRVKGKLVKGAFIPTNVGKKGMVAVATPPRRTRAGNVAFDRVRATGPVETTDEKRVFERKTAPPVPEEFEQELFRLAALRIKGFEIPQSKYSK